jgi:hypothetical protein
MRDGRLKRHPEAYETFQEAQDAFERHTGIAWLAAFCSMEGAYPGEIAHGPTRGSKIYPAVIRSQAAVRQAA